MIPMNALKDAAYPLDGAPRGFVASIRLELNAHRVQNVEGMAQEEELALGVHE